MKTVHLPVADLALTALAPALWGATYVVTSQLLPQRPPDRRSPCCERFPPV